MEKLGAIEYVDRGDDRALCDRCATSLVDIVLTRNVGEGQDPQELCHQCHEELTPDEQVLSTCCMWCSLVKAACANLMATCGLLAYPAKLCYDVCHKRAALGLCKFARSMPLQHSYASAAQVRCMLVGLIGPLIRCRLDAGWQSASCTLG